MKGWVKIHRTILDWGWYTDMVTKTVFLHLLLSAYTKETTYMGLNLKRGSVVVCVTSKKDKNCLTKTLNLTTTEVRTALDKLIRTKEITKKSTNKFTIITITNYDLYQQNDASNMQPKAKQITNKEQTKDNLIATIDIENKELENRRIQEINDGQPQANVKKKRQPLEIYGEFCNVLLTPYEYGLLTEKMGEETTKDYIFRLGAYLESTGRDKGKNAYKNHYAVLLSWFKKDGPAAQTKQQKPKNRFANFTQRTWDFAAIEKMKMEENL